MDETALYFYEFTTTYGDINVDGYTLELHTGASVGEGVPLHEVNVNDDDYKEALIFVSGIVDADVYLNFYIDSEVSNVNTGAKGYVIKATSVGKALSTTTSIIVQVWAFKVYET